MDAAKQGQRRLDQGQDLLASGQPAAAVLALEKALQLLPQGRNHDLAALERAKALAGSGRQEEALAALTPLLEGSPYTNRAWLERARIERALGRPEEARHSLRQAIATSTKGEVPAHAGLELAHLLHEMGHPHASLEAAEAVLRLPVNNDFRCRARLSQGETWLALGHLEEALTAWDAADELRTGRGLSRKVDELLRRDQIPQALRAIDEAWQKHGGLSLDCPAFLAAYLTVFEVYERAEVAQAFGAACRAAPARGVPSGTTPEEQFRWLEFYLNRHTSGLTGPSLAAWRRLLAAAGLPQAEPAPEPVCLASHYLLETWVDPGASRKADVYVLASLEEVLQALEAELHDQCNLYLSIFGDLRLQLTVCNPGQETTPLELKPFLQVEIPGYPTVGFDEHGRVTGYDPYDEDPDDQRSLPSRLFQGEFGEVHSRLDEVALKIRLPALQPPVLAPGGCVTIRSGYSGALVTLKYGRTSLE